MRAVVYDGGRVRPVELPSWVELDAAELVVRCARCELDARLEHLTRGEAERTLGRFALWHGRCRERAAGPARERWREEDYMPPLSVTIVRRRA